MSENIKITGIALDINGRTIYITLDEARELYKQLSELLDKKNDKNDKKDKIIYVYPSYNPTYWEKSYRYDISTDDSSKYTYHPVLLTYK